MSYSHRIADLQLAERLEAFGAVLIEGPKWCGKTTTAEQMSKSVIKMQDTEMQEEYAATAASKPSLLLMGETPRLIDEWQDAPVLWDAVRTMVDRRQVPGQFILTGSTVVDRIMKVASCLRCSILAMPLACCQRNNMLPMLR